MLTLMAVHAHPDDEAISTGGILARYAAEGIQTVLVTCTNGELGDMPGGIKPELSEHDTAVVVAARLDELRASADILGVSHLELLGYHDSGMMGWPQNTAPHAFWNTPVEEATSRLSALMETYRPDVIVTYDENGFYGHPDHIQANRIALAATQETGIPSKLYYTAVGKKMMGTMMRSMREMNINTSFDFDPDDPPFGVDDDTITTFVDVSSVTSSKRKSMAAHASQSENMPFLGMPEEVFAAVFGRESFVRHFDKTNAPTPEDDLFAGLR